MADFLARERALPTSTTQVDDELEILDEPQGSRTVEKLDAARPPDDALDLLGDGGLFKRMLSAGDPNAGKPEPGHEVQVHYVGTLMDGTKFDSSRDRPGNFSFKLGQGAVIKGWDNGVATMHKGEKAELYCRSDYAYGDGGSPPKIPGGATLKFEVELLSWGATEVDDYGDSEGDSADSENLGDSGDDGGDEASGKQKFDVAQGVIPEAIE